MTLLPPRSRGTIAAARRTVPAGGDPTWLTTWADIHAAVYDNEPTVYIGDGTYDIPHNSGLYLANNGQRIIGQSAAGTVLRATGTRGQMQPQAGGLAHDSTKGVIEVAAHGVEIGNLTLTQTLSQAATVATLDTRTQICAGIWAAGNDWFFHDLIVDHCGMGLQLWRGSDDLNNTLKRLHRIVITNWGYRGQEFGHSGYAIYEQCVSGTVQHRDVVCMTGTDYGYHYYGGFTMPCQVDLVGVVILDSGSPLPTGSAGADSQFYMATTERLRVENTHNGVYHDHNPALYANNKVGYSNYNLHRFEAVNTWHINKPDQANQTWLNNTTGTWDEGFTMTGVKNYRFASDRPLFAGTHPLGGSWHVHYGTTPPAGYEVVPGTKQFTSPTNGRPPLMIVRPV